MTLTESQFRIQRLRIRLWCHIVLAALFASSALFFAVKHSLIGAMLLVGFTVLSGAIIMRSVQELSRLTQEPPNAG